MKIPRSNVQILYEIFKKFEKNEDFSINVKYKILKLKGVLEQELEYNLKLLKELTSKYGMVSEEGEILIKKEFIEEVSKQVKDFNSQEIELPDLYFTIEELSIVKIEWRDLEVLMPMIKNE